jgi:hypothetical protein
MPPTPPVPGRPVFLVSLGAVVSPGPVVPGGVPLGGVALGGVDGGVALGGVDGGVAVGGVMPPGGFVPPVTWAFESRGIETSPKSVIVTKSVLRMVFSFSVRFADKQRAAAEWAHAAWAPRS